LPNESTYRNLSQPVTCCSCLPTRTRVIDRRSTYENAIIGWRPAMPIGGEGGTMPTTHRAMRELMTNVAVDRSLDMTARMFGLSKERVITIVRVALPMMAKMAETNPELLKRMYAASLATLPECVEDFYVRMTESQVVRQATMDDYKAAYGTMLDVVNRAAARQASTTDGQARDVVAAALPAIIQALGQANGTRSKLGFLQLLKQLQTEA
jgi:hypothetical protein